MLIQNIKHLYFFSPVLTYSPVFQAAAQAGVSPIGSNDELLFALVEQLAKQNRASGMGGDNAADGGKTEKSSSSSSSSSSNGSCLHICLIEMMGLDCESDV